MPDEPKQQSNTTTKPAGLSIADAAARLRGSRQSANGSAPPAEAKPDGDGDPEVTNLDPEESDAGGSEGEGTEPEVDDDSADTDDDAKDPVYLVKVAGEEVEVPLSDLLESYSRVGDYTKKTQALADQRKQVEKQAENLSARERTLAEREQATTRAAEQYDTALSALQKVLGESDDQWANVDWDRLEEDDPIEAAKQFRRYQQHQQRRAAANAEADRRAREREAETKQQQDAHVAQFQQAIAKAFPQWADEGVRSKDWAGMYKVARELDFTDQEIKSTLDPRVFRLLHKAMQIDRAVAVKAGATNVAPKPAASPVKVVTPSGARPATRAGQSTSTVRDAEKRFAASRTIGAGAALLAARRQAGGRK